MFYLNAVGYLFGLFIVVFLAYVEEDLEFSILFEMFFDGIISIW